MSFTIRRVSEDKEPSKAKLLITQALTMLPALMGSIVKGEEKKISEELDAKRERKLKRTILILFSGLTVMLLLIGMLKVVVRVKALALGMVTMVGADLPADEHGFTNVLLLGTGDADHDGVDLTDTIMVASLDPKNTKSAVLLSIPRDTYVLASEKMGKGRINSLYRDYKVTLVREGEKEKASKEALEQLGKEVGVLIGLPIHGAVKVDFTAFEQVVDLIGGIDIVVPEDIVDTEYPGPNYTYETFSISAGPQHIDGKTALKYARTRHTTSDFSRSGRQQQIIAAMGQKVQSNGLIKNVSKISEIMGIVAKNVESTLSSRELLGLAAMGQKIDSANLVNVQLNDVNGLYGATSEPGGMLYSPPRDQFDGAAVLLPVSIPEFPVTWKQIQAFGEVLFRHRSFFLKSAPIAVLNAGAKEGMARKAGGELVRYNFDIVDIRNLGPRGSADAEQSYIAVNANLMGETQKDQKAQAEATAAYLGKVMALPVKQAPAEAFESADGDRSSVSLVLGKDYTYTPLQNSVLAR